MLGISGKTGSPDKLPSIFDDRKSSLKSDIIEN
jgi:hypothetical protein